MLKYPISVFLDSNIFISSKYDFTSSGTLHSLSNLVTEGKIQIYISHIVEQEVKAHIRDDVTFAYKQLKTAKGAIFNRISKKLLEEGDHSAHFVLLNKNPMIEEVTSYFENFIRDNNMIVLDSKDVDCNMILNNYFNQFPPFENKESKKAEFPDAIMVEKLKSIFNEKNPIHIISSDKGFCKSFDNYKGFSIYNSLGEFLDFVNEENPLYKKITDKLSNLDTSILRSKIIEEANVKNYLYTDSEYHSDLEPIDSEIVDIDNLLIENFTVNEIIDNSNIKVSCNCTAKISVYSTYLEHYLYHPVVARLSSPIESIYDESHNISFKCDLTLSSSNMFEDFKIIDFSGDLYLTNSTLIDSVPFEAYSEEDYLAYVADTLEEYYNH